MSPAEYVLLVDTLRDTEIEVKKHTVVGCVQEVRKPTEYTSF